MIIMEIVVGEEGELSIQGTGSTKEGLVLKRGTIPQITLGEIDMRRAMIGLMILQGTKIIKETFKVLIQAIIILIRDLSILDQTFSTLTHILLLMIQETIKVLESNDLFANFNLETRSDSLI